MKRCLYHAKVVRILDACKGTNSSFTRRCLYKNTITPNTALVLNTFRVTLSNISKETILEEGFQWIVWVLCAGLMKVTNMLLVIYPTTKVHLNYSGILEVTLFQYITSQKVIYQKQDVLNGIWSVQGV